MSIAYRVPPGERVDLSEFVSDYLAMCKESGITWTNKEIANQYLDAFGKTGQGKAVEELEEEELAKQIAYYTEKEN